MLHVYCNDTDWVIAASVEEAIETWLAHNCLPDETAVPDQLEFVQEADDKVLRIHSDSSSEPDEVRTCAEHARFYGKAMFLCSTEW